MVLGAVFNLAPPWFVKQVVDVAIPQHDVRWLWICCAGIIAGPLGAGLLQVAQKYGAERIGQDVMCDLRLQSIVICTGCLRLLHESEARRGGDNVNDVQGVGSAVSGTLVDVTQSTIVLLSTTALLVLLDCLALLAVGLLRCLRDAAGRPDPQRPAARAGWRRRTGMLTERCFARRPVGEIAGGEEWEVRRFRDKAEEIKRLTLGNAGRSMVPVAPRSFEAVAPAAVLPMAAAGDERTARAGTIVAFTALLKRLYLPASQLAGAYATC
jgi:ATP-binding cassette subfamily B protein